MKKIALVIALLMLFGCQQSKVGYERNTQAGEVIAYTVQEYIDTKDNGNKIVFLSQPYCASCEAFKEMLDTYLEDHYVQLYEINIEEEKQKYTQEQWQQILDMYFADYESTPAIYYIDGKQKQHMLKATQDNISEKGFDQWIIQFEIDKK